MYCDLKYEEKLKNALTIYQDDWMKSLPDERELEYIAFSEAFEAKMKKYFVCPSENGKETRILHFTPTVRRITSLLVASVMFIVIALFSVTALRESFFGLLKEYNSDDVATVIYPIDDPSYNPYMAFEKTNFAYIPSGFEQTVYNYSAQFFYHEYTDGEGNYIKIHQKQVLGGVIVLDTEDCEINKVDLFGSNAFYYTKHYNCLYWQYGSSYYLMESNIPVEEMIKIAGSLYD